MKKQLKDKVTEIEKNRKRSKWKKNIQKKSFSSSIIGLNASKKLQVVLPKKKVPELLFHSVSYLDVKKLIKIREHWTAEIMLRNSANGEVFSWSKFSKDWGWYCWSMSQEQTWKLSSFSDNELFYKVIRTTTPSKVLLHVSNMFCWLTYHTTPRRKIISISLQTNENKKNENRSLRSI